MKYKTCPVCGAHLDPGEKCDCADRDVPEIEMTMRPVRRRAKQEEYVERQWKEWFER